MRAPAPVQEADYTRGSILIPVFGSSSRQPPRGSMMHPASVGGSAFRQPPRGSRMHPSLVVGSASLAFPRPHQERRTLQRGNKSPPSGPRERGSAATAEGAARVRQRKRTRARAMNERIPTPFEGQRPRAATMAGSAGPSGEWCLNRGQSNRQVTELVAAESQQERA